MTAQLALSLSLPLLTAIAAILWAGFVAEGMASVPEIEAAERRGDIRTW